MNSGQTEAWWNGVFSIVLVGDIGSLVHYIWTHNVDGIIGTSFILGVVGIAWMCSLVNIK